MSRVYLAGPDVFERDAAQRFAELTRIAHGLGLSPIVPMDGWGNLNSEIIIHPQATFLMRAAGVSMIEFGIGDRDLLVVDRAIRPRHGLIVVAVIDAEFTVKQLHSKAGRVKLKAGNPTYPDIIPQEAQDLTIWGVVTNCIKKLHG